MYFDSKGTGDLNIKVECMNLRETYVIEDSIFFDATERSITTDYNPRFGKVYNDLSLELPTNFVWSMDFKVSSVYGSENRFFLTPTEYNGEQPPYALWIQFGSNGQAHGGSRRNGNTIHAEGNRTNYANTYYNFKVEKKGSTITFTLDDEVIGSMTETWLNDYNSYWFAYSFWKRSYITGTWKNLKLKAL